jgi:nicotinamide mononucleotide transporter
MEGLNYTLFTLWGYPLSVLELVGVLTGLAAVLFASKAWAINFLFGLVNAMAYFVLYYQQRLYSVMLLQIVYFCFSIYGYYFWKHPKPEKADNKQEQRIQILTWQRRWFSLDIILVTGILWGWSVIHLQACFPEYFDPPTYPWLDAVITMGCLVAQYLLSRKIWENWVIWIVLDAASTIMYACLGMVFTSLLFGVFTLIAIKALIDWRKTYEAYER